MVIKKDKKNRNLMQNEDQMPNGRYRYRYTDKYGNRHAIYSWRLVPTDKLPAGKKEDLSLREKSYGEKEAVEDYPLDAILSIGFGDSAFEYLHLRLLHHKTS